MYTYFFYNIYGDDMEENKIPNKPFSYKKIFIILIAFTFLLFVGSYFYFIQFEYGNVEYDDEEIDEEEGFEEVETNSNVEGNETNETTNPETDLSEITQSDIDYYKSKLSKVFSYKNYDVYYDKCVGTGKDRDFEFVRHNFGLGGCYDDSDEGSYFVFNNNTNSMSQATMSSKYLPEKNNYVDSNIYFFLGFDDDSSNELDRGIFDIKKQIINDEYDDYSCGFHSDESSSICDNSNTMIVRKYSNNGEDFALLSLDDYSLILNQEYSSITEIGKNFLVKKNNKYGLYSSSGKSLLDVKYDYLGYNSFLGYIGIIGDSIEYYNTDLVKQDLSKINLENAYTSAYNQYKKYIDSSDVNEYDKYLSMATAESYFWTEGSAMQIHNINEPFDLEGTEFRYKYTGKKYSGKQLVINSHCTSRYIYVIQNNKAYKIDSSEIYLPDSDNESFCF